MAQPKQPVGHPALPADWLPPTATGAPASFKPHAPVLRRVSIDTAANGWVVVLHSSPGTDNLTYVFSTVDDMSKWLASQVWEMRK